MPTTLNRYNRICFHRRMMETEGCCDEVKIMNGGTLLAEWEGDYEGDYAYAPHGASPIRYEKTQHNSIGKFR